MPVNKTIEDLIKKYISDEISDAEKAFLLQEAAKDKEIADVLQLHSTMQNEDFALDAADEQEFRKMRSIAINQIHRYNKNKSKFKFAELWERLSFPFRIPAFSMAFGVFLFFCGILASQYSRQNDFIGSINYTAMQSETLQENSDSPYVFSNAVFREQTDGNVRISVDVERHLEINRQKDDPLVKEILAQSLLNSNNSWQRLKNISDSETIMHPKIKQALINTMLNDNNPIVRQKSLSSLMNYPNDKNIQDALLKVLTNEESVFMRLAAVDYLSNNNVSATFIENELQTQNSNDPIVNQKIRQLKLEQ